MAAPKRAARKTAASENTSKPVSLTKGASIDVFNEAFDELLNTFVIDYYMAVQQLVAEALTLPSPFPTRVFVCDYEPLINRADGSSPLAGMLQRAHPQRLVQHIASINPDDLKSVDLLVVDTAHAWSPSQFADLLSLVYASQPSSKLATVDVVITDGSILRLLPATVLERVHCARIDTPSLSWRLSLLLRLMLQRGLGQCMPNRELFAYLTNQASPEYERVWTSRQHFEHIKLAALHSMASEASSDGALLLAAVDLMAAVLVGKGTHRDWAWWYGQCLKGSGFFDTNDYSCLMATLRAASLPQLALWLKSVSCHSPVAQLLDKLAAGKHSPSDLVDFCDSRLIRPAVLLLSAPKSSDSAASGVKRSFKANVLLAGQCALKFPTSYLSQDDVELPDVAVAYRTLVGFPKVVNVHDWFVAFHSLTSSPQSVGMEGEADVDPISLARFLAAYKQLMRFGVVRSKRRLPRRRGVESRRYLLANFVERSLLEYL